MDDHNEGLQATLRYPLFSAIFNRRSRRISKGVSSISAGNLSYTSTQEPHPLSPLEEALLIAATGITGITMPDYPFRSPEGETLLGAPLLEIFGRTASSVDNAQATHFFLINDAGTYLLKRPENPDPNYFKGELTPDKLIAYAELCKVKVLDKRLDFPREFPFYLDPNRFLSNLPGSTILLPIVDITQQYINGLMYLLSHPDGSRPMIIDDWRLFRPAGVLKWILKGFLNRKLPPIALSGLGTFRIDIEAHLITQNILLTIQAMGLGGWIHASILPDAIVGSDFIARYAQKVGVKEEDARGLGFRFTKPGFFQYLRRLPHLFSPYASIAGTPVGIDGLLEGFCPPYYKNMSEAVDAVIERKFKQPGGHFTDPKYYDKVLKPGLAGPYLKELPHYSSETIACVKDICNYIYKTYKRFPAHAPAMYVPGVWVQAHHLDLEYYDKFYKGGYSDTHANHDRLWHGSE